MFYLKYNLFFFFLKSERMWILVKKKTTLGGAGVKHNQNIL